MAGLPPANGWAPDHVDTLVLMVSTTGAWLPGMATWTTMAGPVLLVTPLGVVATAPLLLVCATSIASYIIRRT